MKNSPTYRALSGICTVIGKLISLGFYLALGFIVLALLTTHAITRENESNPDYVEPESECDKYRFCSEKLGIPREKGN